MKEKKKWFELRWLFYILFPPYAVYRFVRYAKMHWILKTLLLTFVTLILIVSVDVSLNPHRVENKFARESSSLFIKKHEALNMGKYRFVEHAGYGLGVNNEEDVYKVFTDKGLYFFTFKMDKTKKYIVQKVDKVYPSRLTVYTKEKKDTIQPEVKLALFSQSEKLGRFKSVVANDLNKQTIETKKGRFVFYYSNYKVYLITKTNGENVFKTKQALELPVKLKKVMEDNTKTYGTVKDVVLYEIKDDSQVYYFNTSKGLFKTVLKDDGEIVFSKEVRKD